MQAIVPQKRDHYKYCMIALTESARPERAQTFLRNLNLSDDFVLDILQDTRTDLQR
jgi:hypothetical protein